MRSSSSAIRTLSMATRAWSVGKCEKGPGAKSYGYRQTRPSREPLPANFTPVAGAALYRIAHIFRLRAEIRRRIPSGDEIFNAGVAEVSQRPRKFLLPAGR